MKAIFPAVAAALSLLTAPAALRAAEPPPSAAALNAARLAGRVFESGKLELKAEDGTSNRAVLVMEFSAFRGGPRDDPPQASVKLSKASPPEGIKGIFEIKVSVGTSFEDLRLEEKNGVRTMTVTRAVETAGNFRDADKRRRMERILAKESSSFTYELDGEKLILKGFAREGTQWGIFKIIPPQEEVVFRAVERK